MTETETEAQAAATVTVTVTVTGQSLGLTETVTWTETVTARAQVATGMIRTLSRTVTMTVLRLARGHRPDILTVILTELCQVWDLKIKENPRGLGGGPAELPDHWQLKTPPGDQNFIHQPKFVHGLNQTDSILKLVS